MVLSPYPQRYEAPWTLKDGTPVLLRLLKPEDEAMMAEFLHNLSMRTIYFRFFSILESMSHKEIIRYTQIDYDRDMAIVAVEQKSGKDRIIGEGRITYSPNLDACEFSIIIADPWQGKGLGKKLLKICIRIAKEKKAKFLRGNIMAGNERMIELCKGLGFSIDKHYWEGWEGIVRATMRLN
ncbi:MAG TPA: GNAT family N-acetyltransferase [Thermodesulfobacteriota bacterium]|nr:GNAT family N-acetyltransferase [Thermodesulfobacteriota bacterium]